ncbi:MAG: Flp pilus assembly complex ATPase component TadA, partial [Christensenellaceae bacterium]|nr:Flp pilus assembly complex ATPase component TadA [Christensenellaceae bacterium]
MAIKRKYLGETLIDAGIITRQQLSECLAIQKKTGERLGRILKNKGYVTERQLMEIMEFQLGIPFVNLDAINLSHMLSKHIPATLARKHKMVPVRVEGKKLFLAMDDPVDFIALEDARVVSGLDVYPMLATEQAIETAITRIYGNEYAETAIKELSAENANEEKKEQEAPVSDISNAPIVRLVNSLFEQAVKAKASDIHVEPTENDLRVRMRIDGQLLTVLNIPKKAQSAVLTRLKIIGNMDIAEKRLPQDGRYK